MRELTNEDLDEMVDGSVFGDWRGYARATIKADRALNAPADRDVMREAVTVLPDGSAFFTGSFPLPKDHWLYAPRCSEWDGVRDTTADTPHPILTHEARASVVAAVRYAVRGATMCGAEKDFDPDAIVQNAVYALCGPYGGSTAAPTPPTEQKDRPAEQLGEQEPVAWIDEFGNVFPLGAYRPNGKPSWTDAHKRGWKPLYTHPAPTPPARPARACNAGG